MTNTENPLWSCFSPQNSKTYHRYDHEVHGKIRARARAYAYALILYPYYSHIHYGIYLLSDFNSDVMVIMLVYYCFIYKIL